MKTRVILPAERGKTYDFPVFSLFLTDSSFFWKRKWEVISIFNKAEIGHWDKMPNLFCHY